MTPETLEQIRNHARSAAPNEACGVIIEVDGEERVIFCSNEAAEPETSFCMRAADYANAEDAGRVLAVYHSHAGRPDPSGVDREKCEAFGVPYVIVSASRGDFVRIEPTGWQAPLVGREWGGGSDRCADLVRDYYKRVLSIELPNPARPDLWWEQGADLIKDLHAAIGFVWVPKDSLREHDVLVFQTDSKVPHHVGIYAPEGYGPDTMLHHPFRRLSGVVSYDDHWRRVTFGVLRHRSLLRPHDAFVE